MEDKRVVNLSVKPFIAAVIMLIGIMVFTYVLTFILPSGEFRREISEEGNAVIISGTYHHAEGGFSFYKWILSLFLVFGTPDGLPIAVICLFLLVIGGAILPLDVCGCMRYMLDSIAYKYRERRYTLLAITSFFFMILGSVVGSFEEAVPLVPVVIALSYSMGWDAFAGLGMSLLPLGFGFSTGICNLYTVGVAQRLAGLPLFSGISFRILSFALIYPLLLWLLRNYAKKLDKNPKNSLAQGHALKGETVKANTEFTRNEKLQKSLNRFAMIIGFGLALIIISSFVKFLQNIITVIMALIFLSAGIVGCFTAGMKIREFLKQFGKGIMTMLPGVGIILMASSVKYTLTESKTMDTVLNFAVELTKGFSPFVVVLIIYGLVLFMNFFVASASAKAVFLIPLIVPLGQLNGIPSQLSILAFIYGDGFSNLFYPTNPVLLICLGLAGVDYLTWAKWSVKFQLGVLLITCILLLLAKAAGYGT
ncbi:MAG: AbgT family transporter [Treponema sp.]|jgi:uncharacterized ion transporter superfamily protein YfcC|nr:AbgT family transporter [Treponema sp.]